jgi:predicted ArsR family transcriptional regulator
VERGLAYPAPVQPRMTNRTNRPLTPRQHHVLSVLVTRGPSPCNDWSAWFPLETKQVYGVMYRLAWRGLVDVHTFNGRAQVYKITEAGREALRSWDGELEVE